MRSSKEAWLSAEAAEIANHETNGSWQCVDRTSLPQGRYVLRFIVGVQSKARRKDNAYLCVQGCSQVLGIDFDQTFCAAMRGGTLSLLSAVAAKPKLHVRRWDFVAAYLQRELIEDEVAPPPGYSTAAMIGKVQLVPAGEGEGVDRLCIVVKPIYGMAQAGRRWQRTLFP